VGTQAAGTQETMWSVAFAGAAHGRAVDYDARDASYGVLLATNDEGTTWTRRRAFGRRNRR
jgi:hypothetical protein